MLSIVNIVRSVRRILHKPVSRKFEYGWILERARACSEVLDVGCVRGTQIQDLTVRLLEKGCSVTGISLQPVDFKHEHFRFIEGDVLKATFDARSFDIIVASHVLQHLGLPYFGFSNFFVENGDALFVDKAWRWLKSGGRLFVVVPIAKKFQYILSSNYKYRIYDSEKLFGLFKGKFAVGEGTLFDGAHSSKRKVKEAKAVLLELEKIECA